METVTAPAIAGSTRDERESYIRHRYPCISDCDAGGICAVFRGKDPVVVYKDYIDGNREFMEIAREYAR